METENQSNFDRMLEKVKKLLTKAEDPATGPHEAEALNDKAAELIAKYGIEAAMLTKTDPTKVEKIVSMKFRVQEPYIADKLDLASEIAKAFRCKPIYLIEYEKDEHGGYVRTPAGRFKKSKILRIIGFESDIKRADFLFVHLLVQAQHGIIKSDADKPSWENTKSWRVSWFQGFNNAVGTRLRAAEKRAVAEADLTTTGTALVVADRSSEVAAAFTAEYPKTRQMTRAGSNGSGRGAGWNAGQKADIGAGRVAGGTKALGS